MNTVKQIEEILANGGKEIVLEENRHKLTNGDLSTAKLEPSQAQKNRQKLDALRAKIDKK